MSNCIEYALRQVRYRIPPEILNKVFIANDRWRNRLQPFSLESIIRDRIIDERVIPDCDMIGGTQIAVPLDGCPMEIIDNWTTVYRIPKRLTQNRSITHVLNISFGEGALMTGGVLSPSQGSALMDTANQILQSNLPIPMVTTAQVSLIGENVVMVADNLILPPNAYLRCWVENDSNMSHVKPPYWKTFANLVIYATKAYIWVNSQIPMDKNFIFSGAELGRFKDVVDTYADANELYDVELNEVWRKAVIFNDYNAKQRYLKALVGGLT